MTFRALYIIFARIWYTTEFVYHPWATLCIVSRVVPSGRFELPFRWLRVKSNIRYTTKALCSREDSNLQETLILSQPNLPFLLRERFYYIPSRKRSAHRWSRTTKLLVLSETDVPILLCRHFWVSNWNCTSINNFVDCYPYLLDDGDILTLLLVSFGFDYPIYQSGVLLFFCCSRQQSVY